MELLALCNLKFPKFDHSRNKFLKKIAIKKLMIVDSTI
jgi:hypothetical protein